MFSVFEVFLLNLYERCIRFYVTYIHAIIVKIKKKKPANAQYYNLK